MPIFHVELKFFIYELDEENFEIFLNSDVLIDNNIKNGFIEYIRDNYWKEYNSYHLIPANTNPLIQEVNIIELDPISNETEKQHIKLICNITINDTKENLIDYIKNYHFNIYNEQFYLFTPTLVSVTINENENDTEPVGGKSKKQKSKKQIKKSKKQTKKSKKQIKKNKK